jgi:ATP-dependent RNA helicase DDX19/DBP5
VLFSATYSDDVMSFAKQVVPDPIIIRLKRNEESLDNIKQVRLWWADPQKMINYLSG